MVACVQNCNRVHERKIKDKIKIKKPYLTSLIM